MPSRIPPRNVQSAIRLLAKARDIWKLTEDPSQRAITPDQFAQIDDSDPANLLSQILSSRDRLRSSKARRAQATADATTLRRSLVLHITHFHRALDMAIARGRIPAGARAHYARDIAATALPPLGRQIDITTAAQKIITGEATRRDADGPAFVPMTNPAPGEIAPILADYQTALGTLLQAKVETNALQETVSNRRKELIALARDISETIRFHHRKDPDPSSRRAKNELWGVTYDYKPRKKRSPTTPDRP